MDDGTPWRPEQTLHLTAAGAAGADERLSRARGSVEARLRDLEKRRRRSLEDAAAAVERQLYAAAAKYLQEATTEQAVATELELVLELLRPPVLELLRPPTPADDRPHSRACGWPMHPHGVDCSPNCPTCGGRP